jgi:Skp family chaperone for outer membrane proteins
VLDVRTTICTATVVAVLFSLGLAVPQANAQTGTNVAVIDIPYIFKNFVRFKQAIDDIKKDIDDYKNVVNDQQKQLRDEAAKLELYKPGTKEYKDVEESIARMKMTFSLESAKRQKDFMEREAQVYFNAYREVERVVADLAQRNRIGLVLRHSAEEMDPSQRDSIMQGINRIVVFQDRLSITELVLEQLNRGTPPVRQTQNTQPVIPPRNPY